MEVHGDKPHRIKAWAFATVHGIEITNFAPNDRELIEAQKIMAALNDTMEPAFKRPGRQQRLIQGAKPII